MKKRGNFLSENKLFFYLSIVFISMNLNKTFCLAKNKKKSENVLVITGLFGMASGQLEQEASLRGWKVLGHSSRESINEFICNNPGLTVIGFSMGAEAIKLAQKDQCAQNVTRWLSIDPPGDAPAHNNTRYFFSAGYPLFGSKAAGISQTTFNDENHLTILSSSKNFGNRPVDLILKSAGIQPIKSTVKSNADESNISIIPNAPSQVPLLMPTGER